MYLPTFLSVALLSKSQIFFVLFSVTVSATWPDAVRRLASTLLRDPVRVTVGSDDLTANRRVEQGMCEVQHPSFLRRTIT